MPTKDGPEDEGIVVRFGGGQNSAASEDEIEPREAALGDNFILDRQNSAFRNRKPFDLLGTAPNAGSIDGFANLLKADGTVSMLVQAGTTVYEWNGTTFTSRGTVASGAKIRGPLSQNWQLADKVIITDLALQEAVLEWNGTTLSNTAFTDETLSTAWTGDFRARYCVISNERAIFANIHDNSSEYPHMIVGSLRGDYTVISVSQRPSSALSEEDPFFLVQPDYRYINGMVNAFDSTVTSSQKGDLFVLTGSSAKDFAFDEFFPRSGASGGESVTYVGSDIFYGRQGRIESVIATDKYGDVENNDLTTKISDKVETYTGWTIVYNSRNQRVYCFPTNQAEVWVYFKSMSDTELSPWARWRTSHAVSMQPTAVMNMLDPVDGLEYVYFGDSSGNFYRMEGSGASGDAGSASIRSFRDSSSVRLKLDQLAYQVEGWVTYRASNETEVSLTILYNGENVFNESLSLTLPATTDRTVYSGGYYYSNGNYYSEALTGRLSRERFWAPSGSTEFQIRIEYTGTEDINIQEIGLRFEASA